MDAFLKTLQTLPEASELIARVENGGCPAVLTGTAPVQRACIGAAKPHRTGAGNAAGKGMAVPAQRRCLPGVGAQPPCGALPHGLRRGSRRGGHH